MIDSHIEAGGTRLFLRRVDPPSDAPPSLGRAIVFLHHGLGSVGQWRDYPERLAEATGLPAIVYDREGHGRSMPPRVRRTSRYLHKQAWKVLPEVLAACEVERPILVGHSEGGSIALLYAAAFPDAPLGLVTEAAHVYVEDRNVAHIPSMVEAYEHDDLRVRLRRHHGLGTDAMFRAWSETWLRPTFRDWNITALLDRIQCPSLVMVGADDPYVSRVQLDAIVAGVSGPSEGLIIPNSDHSPHHEARETVLATTARFIDGLVRTELTART